MQPMTILRPSGLMPAPEPVSDLHSSGPLLSGFPMFAVVYLCCKLGQVTGQGLFAVIKQHYARWIFYFFLATAVAGNVVEAPTGNPINSLGLFSTGRIKSSHGMARLLEVQFLSVRLSSVSLWFNGLW